MEATEEPEEEQVQPEPELPNFSKVSSLTLSELGLPPRMFTAGSERECESVRVIFVVFRLSLSSLLIPTLP